MHFVFKILLLILLLYLIGNISFYVYIFYAIEKQDEEINKIESNLSL